MNLAVHNINTLRALVFRGIHKSFNRLGIVPWVTPDFRRHWSGVDELVENRTLHLHDLNETQVALYEIFHDKHRKHFVSRETKLLFLAELSASVVLTNEVLMIRQAKNCNLRVCSGDERELEAFFPLVSCAPPDTNPPPEDKSPDPPPSPPPGIILSTDIPTSGQVPDGKESVCETRDNARAGRGGSMPGNSAHAA